MLILCPVVTLGLGCGRPIQRADLVGEWRNAAGSSLRLNADGTVAARLECRLMHGPKDVRVGNYAGRWLLLDGDLLLDLSATDIADRVEPTVFIRREGTSATLVFLDEALPRDATHFRRAAGE